MIECNIGIPLQGQQWSRPTTESPESSWDGRIRIQQQKSGASRSRTRMNLSPWPWLGAAPLTVWVLGKTPAFFNSWSRKVRVKTSKQRNAFPPNKSGWAQVMNRRRGKRCEQILREILIDSVTTMTGPLSSGLEKDCLSDVNSHTNVDTKGSHLIPKEMKSWVYNHRIQFLFAYGISQKHLTLWNEKRT